MDEQRIEQLAPELGRQAASQVDVERTALVVRERLRQPVRVAWWRRPVLQMAAALALVLGAGALILSGGGSSGAPLLAGPVELRELAAAQLSEVLDSLDVARPVSEFVPAGLGDLDETELRELLELMEG